MIHWTLLIVCVRNFWGQIKVGEKKTKLQPSRSPRRKDYQGATRRAQQIHDRLKEAGYRFPDSAEIIRADRDSRI